MYTNQEIGKIGEDIATEYLQKNGYNVIERNFYCSQGEIDIIAIDKEELVFIEVKTRTDTFFGEPGEAVNYYKIKHMVNAIKYYTYKRNLMDEFIRIDVIEVYLKNDKVRINHIKKAIS